MLFRGITVLVLILATFSCSAPAVPEIPKDILDKDKMAAGLTDLSIMEASINVSHFNAGNKETDSLRFNIYKQHNITRAAYDSSIAFYSKHPEEFKEIYDAVVEKLTKLQ